MKYSVWERTLISVNEFWGFGSPTEKTSFLVTALLYLNVSSLHLNSQHSKAKAKAPQCCMWGLCSVEASLVMCQDYPGFWGPHAWLGAPVQAAL